MPLLSIDNRKLFYVIHEGNSDNQQLPTLLFIHGLGSSHTFYETITPQLVALGLTCIAFDTAGSGLSDLGPKGHGIDGIARDALQLLSSLNVQPANTIVVGHSMGTLVASTIAASNELAGVVLIGALIPSEAVQQAFVKRVETVNQGGMITMADTIPAAATGSKSTPWHRAFIRTLLLLQSTEGYTSLCNAIIDAPVPRFDAIRTRLLVIAGEDDRTTPPTMSKRIIEKCSNARSTGLEVLSGVGHWHCIEAPDKIVAIIERLAQTQSANPVANF